MRGSAADYLVDEANHLLEVAGRSRRSDVSAAWEQRWQRLTRTLNEAKADAIVQALSEAMPK